MSRKNHKKINGQLLRTDKQFRHLKESQKEKISNWLYEEFSKCCDEKIKPKIANEIVLSAVCEKIEDAGIWISEDEVRKFFYSRKYRFQKRYAKYQARIEAANADKDETAQAADDIERSA